MSKIYQIQVSLKNIRPKIWRRLLVPSDLLLLDLHRVIQTAMGWTNSHLHQFVKDRIFYVDRIEEPTMAFFGTRTIEYKKKKISDLLKCEKEKMVYEYDFGDGWEHEILLEKILPADPDATYPVCIAGKRNCPPEDCGGPWGYANFLKAIQNPEHEEHEEFLEWIGGEFDPEHFDKDEVNEALQEENYGCLEL
ncbi:MAG TPA: plasmid pRiA4b ORF-3 family protein [bacterium]|nr:plasmid pRiA4b ORF-3 family protein [bacterium]